MKDAEPLVHPKGSEKAGQPITDWQGNPVGDKGVVFFNAKDKAVQAVPGDGTGVIIINEVNEQQAASLHAKINELGGDPNKLSLVGIKEVLSHANSLGLTDTYNSDKGFIASKMNPIERSATGVEAFGLHRRDDRDINHAVHVPGKGEFQGPAGSPQKFENGAVILRQGDDTRLIQPEIFERTYQRPDGSPIRAGELTPGGKTGQERGDATAKSQVDSLLKKGELTAKSKQPPSQAQTEPRQRESGRGR